MQISSPRAVLLPIVVSVAIGLGSIPSSGCNSSVETPSVKDPRKFVFNVDTLQDASYQVIGSGIWGSSPDNVYVVCRSGSVRNKKLFRFNGSTWTQLDISGFGTSQVGFDLVAIHGFAPNNIWLGGSRNYFNPTPPPNFIDSSLIIHFNGTSWNEVVPSFRQRSITSIGGSEEHGVWFGGINGTLFRMENSQLVRDSLPLAIPTNADPFFVVADISVVDGAPPNILLLTPYYDTYLKSSRLYQYNGSWTQARSWTLDLNSIANTNDGVVVLVGERCFKFQSGQEVLLPSLESIRGFDVITSSHSTFVAGIAMNDQQSVRGVLIHYNGLDSYDYLLEASGLTFTDLWADGTEVFVVANDGYRTYVYHGQ